MNSDGTSRSPTLRPSSRFLAATFVTQFALLQACVIVDGEETEEGFRGTCQRYTAHLPTCGEPVETEDECVSNLKMLAKSVSDECAWATQSLLGCYSDIPCDIWDEREIGCEDEILRSEELCSGT